MNRIRKSRPHDNNIPEEHPSKNSTSIFELEVLDGLATICEQELDQLIGTNGKIFEGRHPAQITFEFSGHPAQLLKLSTAVAVFQLLYFKVPHPLNVVQGHNLPRFLAAIEAIRKAKPFVSFRIGAAGSDSTAFQKIKRIISDQTRLKNDEEEGEMSIRFRRSRIKAFGWDVLIRLTPRPLSARSWRIENMPGALNATIAAAMVLKTDPSPTDSFLNMMCGSGTIMAERAALGPVATLIGIDNSSSALKKARSNLSHLTSPFELLEEDIKELTLEDGSVNAICADFPWGRLIGKSEDLQDLYTQTISQATRVCANGCSFIVLTQENKIFESAFNKYKSYWKILTSFRVKQADYKPTLYCLRRNKNRFDATPLDRC